MRQYVQKPLTLTLILYTDDNKIKVCHESFLPFIYLSLLQHEKNVQTSAMIKTDIDVLVKVDYTDLLEALAKLVEVA